MAKVIKVSDETYALIEDVAFKNGVKIKHLVDKVIEVGIKHVKDEQIVVNERGREVKIKW